MTRDEALERIKNLLALSQNNDNAHEAALAAAKAQELMLRYQLSEDAIEDRELGGNDVYVDPVPIEKGGVRKRPAIWRISLSTVVARACNCQTVLYGVEVKVIGAPDDVAQTRILYKYLLDEIDRLCRWRGKGLGALWANNYRLGAVNGVQEVLRADRQRVIDAMRLEAGAGASGESAGQGGSAVVRFDAALARLDKQTDQVRNWIRNNLQTTSKTYAQPRMDADARSLGYADGKKIQVEGRQSL